MPDPAEQSRNVKRLFPFTVASDGGGVELLNHLEKECLKRCPLSSTCLQNSARARGAGGEREEGRRGEW